MSVKPSLVILAAGMGSRFGGLKQIKPVGPSGETIMDYSVFDAARAGFGRIVFIIRKDMEQDFREVAGKRFEKRFDVSYAFQQLDDLPDGIAPPTGRTKPWGTGHAVLAARDEIKEPFAVINADDFYGASSYAELSSFLADHKDTAPASFAMVGYELRATLSEAGAVNRGVCECTPDGWLERITEVEKIHKDGQDGLVENEDGSKTRVDGTTPVSMNLWGFTPALIDDLQRRFTAFMQENSTSEKAEFYLPAAVQGMMDDNLAQVKVLSSRDAWCGVTNPDDLQRVRDKIASMIANGKYPDKLWT